MNKIWKGTLAPIASLIIASLVVVADYRSGPAIQFPVFFLLPVVLASWYSGVTLGVLYALILPLTLLMWMPAGEGFHIGNPVVLNAIVRMVVLGLVAYVLDLAARRTRDLKVLRGLLPICGACMKVRDESGKWKPIDRYIVEHSEARFSHELCPTCDRKYYRKTFP